MNRRKFIGYTGAAVATAVAGVTLPVGDIKMLDGFTEFGPEQFGPSLPTIIEAKAAMEQVMLTGNRLGKSQFVALMMSRNKAGTLKITPISAAELYKAPNG